MVTRGCAIQKVLICIVPVVGTGSPGDAKRSLYAPLPPRAGSAALEDGIIAYNSILSDDGRFALIELVARDRSVFEHLFNGSDCDKVVEAVIEDYTGKDLSDGAGTTELGANFFSNSSAIFQGERAKEEKRRREAEEKRRREEEKEKKREGNPDAR